MTEKTTEELAAEAQAEQAAANAAAAKKTKRALSVVAPSKGFKVYASVQKHTYPFEVQIAGEVITGQWSRADGFVEFLVPDHLVEGFEKHFHFTAGNLVAAD